MVRGATESNPHGTYDHHMLVIAVIDDVTLHVTVAERDTAAAAQAALGPPESRRWPPKGRPSAAAGRRGSAAPAKNFKIVIQFTNG